MAQRQIIGILYREEKPSAIKYSQLLEQAPNGVEPSSLPNSPDTTDICSSTVVWSVEDVIDFSLYRPRVSTTMLRKTGDV